jgi:predicted Rossmann fold nucleotide-binding protein DprA/Smf involved in DNA uptake
MKIPVYATPSSIFSPTSEGILDLIERGHVKPVVDLKHFLHQHFPSQNISSRTPTPIDVTDEEQ